MKNKRLEAICSFISNEESVLDIGCDHGYLALMLKDRGHDGFIICSDNKRGPLENAINNLKDFSNISFVLSDGANNINQIVDCCVMAGMGNYTIQEILEQSKEYFAHVDKLILQTNNNVDMLRKWLNQHDYLIEDEVVVFDYKYYEILVIKHGKQILSEEEIKYGPHNLRKKDVIFINSLKAKVNTLTNVLKSIDKNKPDYLIIENKIKEINEVINR